jgi:hypothetical protein
MMSAFDAIGSCKYLYLDAVSEPQINRLRVVILEAATGDTLSEEVLAAHTDETVRSVLAGSRAIEHLPGCRKFELLPVFKVLPG